MLNASASSKRGDDDIFGAAGEGEELGRLGLPAAVQLPELPGDFDGGDWRGDDGLLGSGMLE